LAVCSASGSPAVINIRSPFASAPADGIKKPSRENV
jgi:hypothetical protein